MRANIPPPIAPIRATPSAQHRRQMLWQVWLPLIITLLVVLALAVLAIIGAVQGSSQVERWGNISAVIVILPVLLWGFLFLVIFGGLAYAVTVLVRKMPGWMLKAQLAVLHIALVIRRAADSATRPVFAVSTFTTRAATLWDRIFHRRATRRTVMP